MPQVVLYYAALYIAGSYVVAALVVYAYTSMQADEAKEDARNKYNAAQVDRMTNVASALAPRELVMGRVRKGGSVFFKGSVGAQNQVLYLAIAIAGHEIDAVEEIWLNDQRVTLNGIGQVLEAPYGITSAVSEYGSSATITGYATLPATYAAGTLSVTKVNMDGYPENQPVTWLTPTTIQTTPGSTLWYMYYVFNSNAQIFTYLGQAGQVVDPDILAAFPSMWVAQNTVQGVAYMLAKFTYSDTSFPTGAANLTVVVRGAKLYDPRTTLTAWSENPALMMRHVHQHPNFGKATVTAAEDARFVTAANACDTATVYTVAGVPQPSRALFKAALVVPFGTAPKSAFDDITQAMGGFWAFAGGSLHVKAGVYTASVKSLTDVDLAGVQRQGASESQGQISTNVHRERAKKYNTVKVKIWDQGQDYKQVSLTPLVGAALVARDGAELVQEVSFPAISYAPQALHVAGILMRDARDPLTVDIPFKLSAYALELFDTVDLTLAHYGWVAKTFIILSRTWNPDASLRLTLKETTAAITQLDAGFPAQGFASNTALPKPWVVASMGTITVSSGTAELAVQGDGTVTSRMRVSWPQVQDAAVIQSGKIEVQYLDTLGSGQWMTLTAPGDETQVVTSEVTDGTIYIIRVRARTSLGVGDWCPQVSHQVLGKTEPPPVFDFFSVMAQPDGTRQYNFGYNSLAAQPVDWLGAEIRYTSGTVPAPDWATMTPLQDSTTYYTNSPVELNAPLSGTWTFACKSLDTTGNESAYLVRTITLPDRRLGNVFDEYYEHTDGWLGTLSGCHLQDGLLEANDTTTWATLPATWAGWTRWNMAPTSPISYTSPARDFGTVIAGQVNSTVDADGTVVQELATSADGTTWSAWGSAAAPFSTRYLKLRLTITATGPAPVPAVRAWSYQINAPIRSEYLNDVVLSSLTGAYRIGVGDVRIPLAGVYAVLKRTSIVIQDSSAGTWTSTRIDQSPSPAPRWQFRLNGVLADPAFVDFFIEGY